MSRRKTTILSSPAGISSGRLVELDGMFFSSTITGEDAAAGRLAPEAAGQVGSAFANLARVLGQARLGWDEVGIVNASVAAADHGEVLHDEWRRVFAGTAVPPVLKINEYGLPGRQLVQLQAIGRRGGRRVAVQERAAKGLCLGDLYFTEPIDGTDPATGRLPPAGPAQMAQAFRNLDRFCRRAGGGTADLVHVLIYIRGREDQADMLDAWLAAFPKDGDRPARKAIFDETLARGPASILLMGVGVTGKVPRVNLEVPGISKKHPNPMGCRAGEYVFSSGLGGDDPKGLETRKDAGVRAALAFANMAELLKQAGGGLDDIGFVAITVNDYIDEAAILEQWRRVFPDPRDEPARHVMAFGGRGTYPVQLHIVGRLTGG